MFFDLHTSWRRFKLGLALFAAGVVLLFGVSTIHISLYYVSLLILVLGFIIAMSGYLGIFMQRFSFLKEKKIPPNSHDK